MATSKGLIHVLIDSPSEVGSERGCRIACTIAQWWEKQRECPDDGVVERGAHEEATCPSCRRFMCLHRNIHPGRVDGVTTVCYDCKSTVHVSAFKYASPTTMEDDYKRTLTKLQGG